MSDTTYLLRYKTKVQTGPTSYKVKVQEREVDPRNTVEDVRSMLPEENEGEFQIDFHDEANDDK